jgi:peptide/nickel transport system permease protein
MALPPDPTDVEEVLGGVLPGPEEAPPAPKSFTRQALADTFRRPGARVGAAWVAVLAFCGVFAPFLANSHPLLLKMDGDWTFPLLRHLTPADVVLLLAALAAGAVALARDVSAGQKISLFLFVLTVLLLATAAPWVHGRVIRVRDAIMPTGRGVWGWLVAAALAVVVAGLAGAALVFWLTKIRIPARTKAAFVLPALVVAGLLVWHPIRPPETVIYEQYREAARAGRVQFMLRPPVPYSPTDYLRDMPATRQTPPTRQHWLGVENYGADVLSRMIHAARIALTIGFIATGIGVVIGVVVGGLMGYFVGAVDIIGMRLIEIFESIPTLVLLITVVAVFGRNIYLMMAIIGLTSWTADARFIRAEFLRLRKQDFVQAAVAAGLPLRSVIFRHMLPNGIAPVLVGASFGIASAILTESVLSFLGLGLVQEPSWGGMLNQARAAGGNFSWWIAVFPGMAIFLTVFAYNLIGEALRDALDPKLRGIK